MIGYRHAELMDAATLRHARPSITVRQAEPDDAPALHRLFAEPKVLDNTVWHPVPYAPMAQTRRRLEDRAGVYVLVACSQDEIVGSVTLATYDEPVRRDVGALNTMAVADAWQGRGIGSRLMVTALDLADNWLNLMRLELYVRTDNLAAIALYTKFGFEVEGTLRRYGFRGGRYRDVHIMGRLRVDELPAG